MKPKVWLFILGFSLSSLSYVSPFKCVQCDPNALECEDIPINCEKDPQFGEIFDSCYTYDMLIKGKNYSYIHTIKGCSIEMGCNDLREELCENANTTLAADGATVKSCTISCCTEHDYCNAAEATPTTIPLKTTTKKIATADVLGYKSCSTSHIPRIPCALVILFMTCFIMFNY